MAHEQLRPVKIAYLYYSTEFDARELLREHLISLERDGLIKELPDVPAGANFQEQTTRLLKEAQIIILLISRAFEAKSVYSSPEMIDLIGECARRGNHIWPIIVKPVYWSRSMFREYEVFFGEEENPIALSTPPEKAYKQIVEKIDKEITCMLSENWVQEGDNYYHGMCLDEALVAYNNSLDCTPDYPPALLGSWRIFRKRKVLEKEEQCLEGLLSPNISLPQKGKDALPLVSQRISLMRSYCKGCALLDLGRASDARTAFQEVYQRIASPMDKTQKKLCARAYLGEGDTFISEGRRSNGFVNYYNQALSAYEMANEKAKSLDADDPIYLTRIGDAHIAFAEAYAMLNNRALVSDYSYNALETYEQVISRYSYPPAFIGRGDIYFLQHSFDKALELYEKALELYGSALKYDQYVAHACGGKGNVLLALNKPEKALQAFEQALAIDDCDARYHYGKGQALARLKRYQDAFESYKVAVNYGFLRSREFVINYARALVELGEIECMYGQQSKANKYYAKAYNLYQSAFEPGRNEKDIDYGYGKIFFVDRNWSMALKYYDKALSLNSFMGEAYLGKGKTHLELGNYRDAFDCFNRASKYCQLPESILDRSDVETAFGDAHYHIAQHVNSNDRDSYLENACSNYKGAIAICENALAYAGLGKTYAKLRRNQEAIDALSHALELMPDLVQCYFMKGRCYDSLGQYVEAYAEYDKAFKAGLNTFSLQKARGEVLLTLKRYEESAKVFQDMIADMIKDMTEYTKSDFVYAYCSNGIALHGQNLDEKALNSFLHAFGLDPSIIWHQIYRYALQEIHFSFERELYNDPDDPTIYRRNGDVLRILGEENGKAISAYTNAIAYGDMSTDTYYFRGLVYEKIQDYQNAFNDYCTVLQIDQNHQSAQQGKMRVEQMIGQPQTSFWQKIRSRLKLSN